MRLIVVMITVWLLVVPSALSATKQERREAMRWYWSSGARCVKNHEGAWTSNTGNGYYGGFQADHDFQRAYGREFYYRIGYAHLWKPWQQIVMAHRGWKSRGWGPWPTTSVMCGLR